MINRNDITVQRRNVDRNVIEYKGIIVLDKTISVSTHETIPLSISSHDDSGDQISPISYQQVRTENYDALMVHTLQKQVHNLMYGELRQMLRDLVTIASSLAYHTQADSRRVHEIAQQLSAKDLI